MINRYQRKVGLNIMKGCPHLSQAALEDCHPVVRQNAAGALVRWEQVVSCRSHMETVTDVNKNPIY